MNLKNISLTLLFVAGAYGAYYYFTRRKKTEIITDGNWTIQVEKE